MKIHAYRKELPEEALRAVSALYALAFGGPPRFEKWTLETARAEIQRFLDGDADCFLCEEGDGTISAYAIGLPLANAYACEELVGFGADRRSYYFASIATHPELREKGRASALHQRREQAAIARGFERLSVRARADYEPALKLLRRMGFVEIARYVSLMGGREAERVVLEKPLTRG